jgi:hypothetical protein
MNTRVQCRNLKTNKGISRNKFLLAQNARMQEERGSQISLLVISEMTVK